MKHLLVLTDGMADYPLQALGGKTPLMVAKKPHLDFFTQNGYVGKLQTVPKGFEPGSDVANLNILGYAPATYYTGRSPLEALSIGIHLEETDMAIRCNFITLSEKEPFTHKILVDYCAGEITTQESAELIDTLNEHLRKKYPSLRLYTGTAYRHCLVWKNAHPIENLMPPHNISDQVIKPYLPQKIPLLHTLIEDCSSWLEKHPINLRRMQNGLPPANAIWLWGAGTTPQLPSFHQLYQKKGGMISAVDLLKGIAVATQMERIDVPGATGNLHTNYAGKVAHALRALDNGLDFVYLHIEAPDECGHRGDIQGKISAIEAIDHHILSVLHREAQRRKDFHLTVLPDHFTPLALKKHTSDCVPFVYYHKDYKPSIFYSHFDENLLEQVSTEPQNAETFLQRFFQGFS